MLILTLSDFNGRLNNVCLKRNLNDIDSQFHDQS